MGLGGVEGPPKKKLKQAQLNFCVTSERVNNKRKLSDASDGLAPKLSRKDSGDAKTQAFNKENVVASDANKVQKKAEPANDVVVVIDDNSIDSDKPVDEATVSKGANETSREDVEVVKDDSCQDSKAEEAAPVIINEAPSKTEESIKPVNSLACEPITVESSEPKAEDLDVMDVSAVSETPSDTENGKECPDSIGRTDSKHDKSVESDQADMNTSEDDLATSSPSQKTTPVMQVTATPSSSTKKAERERRREEKLRLRKEKEELKRKEKEDKEKKKQEDLRLKEEEKRLKEEAKKRKEEEKRKKEELKEEAHRKKKEERMAEERKEKEKEERKKAAFTKFFILEKTPKPSLPKEEETEANTDKSERPKFMPFPVKSDMRLAVQVRHTLTDEEKNHLSKVLASDQAMEETYLKELKNRKPMTSLATWPLSEEQHDVIIVEFNEDDKACEEPSRPASIAKAKDQNAKLLQFHENRRPPYWGTWRKSSRTVGPRKPFGQDKILDYEVDSDSEWEDEEEGEDIDKEDGDSDKEEADDENVGENGYVLDNTFVPHGYLSDEEAAEAEDDDSIEDQKLKLTVLKQEFDQELKSKTQRLQPRLLGCVYISNKTLEVSKSLYDPLMKLRCKWDSNEEPIDVQSPPVVECNPSPSVSNAKFPSSLVGQLAKLIHGNRSSLKALISQFLDDCDKDTQLSAVSKRAVFLKVKEIAAKTYSSESGRLVWAVNPDLCGEFGLEPIIDQSRAVPPVSPVVEPVKPKDSPLANFLKKPTPQGPIKRVSTTLISRLGPSETTHGVGAVHVDTPRPKVTPQSSSLAGNSDKPIRRVATTLLSSVAGPVKNKTFNVGEIEKPGQTVPKAKVIDLTDSMDGITPLSSGVDNLVPPILADSGTASLPHTSVKDDNPTPADAKTAVHSPNSSPTTGETANQPASTANGSTSPVKGATLINNLQSNGSSAGDLSVSVGNAKGDQVSATADSAVPSVAVCDSSQPAVTVKDSSQPVAATSPPALVKDKPPPSDASETDNSTVSTSDAATPAVTSADSAAPGGTGTSLMETDNPPELPMETDNPPELPTTQPNSSIDANPPPTLAAPNPSPATPTVRKRVALTTLSRSVSKPKTPVQKVSIPEMFCRKQAKKSNSEEPASL